MGSSRFKKAIGRVKDQTTIRLVRVGSSTSLPDLEVAIVKATSHEEDSAEERHIREILTLTSCSQSCVASCVSIISGRLDKTRNWVVALKALILIQRLLQDGDPEYEQEIFFATRHGTRLLNMSEFRDVSMSSNSWDYSAFVRTYALYLDEQLEYRMQGKRGKHSAYSHDKDEEEEEKQQENVNAHQYLFSRLQHLMQLLERFLACRPTGPAWNHRIVMVALNPIVKQSFQLYYDITEILSILIDRFTELEISESVKVYEILCRVRKQYEDLDYFYDSCKSVGITRTSEYPEVDKISQNRLDIMDEFIREKPLTEQYRIKVPEAEDDKEEDAEDLEPEPEPKPQPGPHINASKILPGPEESKEEKQEEDKKEVKKTQDVGDLLNLGDDALTEEEQAQKMALALFDDGSATTAPTAQTGTSAWDAYKGSDDWETALVESTSHLSNQQPSLPGGFDTLILDGMYQQATQTSMANSGMTATGSLSSFAFGSVGRPAMLALPASPSSDGRGDPFSPSLSVAPPPYVQIAEMENKQRLLVEEQMMWQQYQRNGVQGQVDLGYIQSNQHPFIVGGFTHPK